MANITGTNNNDTLKGTDFADFIDGLAGQDAMSGGKGDDTYYADNIGDKVIETLSSANGGGYDIVNSSVSYTLGANVEELDLTGGADINATGNTLNNYLGGNGGDNTLDGGAGADVMVGGAGEDVYHVDNLGDLVAEGPGGGNDRVISTVALTAAFNNVEDYDFSAVNAGLHFTANALNNYIFGGAGNDVIDAGAGEDVIDGGKGADQMTGGDGNDIYYVDNIGDKVIEFGGLGSGDDSVYSTVSVTLAGNVEIGRLLGTGSINMTGNDLDNEIYGNDGANVIDGGVGADGMSGEKGNDTYIVDSSTDSVSELAGEGIDLVKSSVDFSLSANVENLTLTGSNNVGAWGNDLNNVLTGNDGNNELDGGKGNDTMIGGKGDDNYVVDSAGDKVIESISDAAGGGTDTVTSSISFSLASLVNVENLALTGMSAINATGNTLDNSLLGNNGNNVLDGGKGADTMYGYDGDDTYHVDNVNDMVSENTNQGTDAIISTVALPIAVANVEDYYFNTNAAVSFTGNAWTEVVSGGAGNDVLNAGAGVDVYLYGNGGDDKLTGDNNDNVLNGGTGADVMNGGLGADRYFVDNVNDQVMEQFTDPGAVDIVITTVSIAQLWTNVEDVYLDSTAAINVTGNDLDNHIFGSTGANIIDGGAGADTMYGDMGNDTYIVDNASDVVGELANQGIDLVKSSVSYTLTANVENLTLTGSMDIAGIGNKENNVIVGNDGGNYLDGGVGADVLTGGKGDDLYVVDNVGDKVVETISNALGGGHDLVVSSISFSLAGLVNVEDLNLSGTGDINATGNALDNHLQGNDESNVIDGGSGADIMEGHGGDDTYHVDNLNDVVLEDIGSGKDTIISTVNFGTAVANVENYYFNVSSAVNFTGDSADNEIHGGSGNDTINGGDGINYLLGLGGNDHLIGGQNEDTLVGGVGADKMEGNDGNDTYYVDNVGDQVIEYSNPNSGAYDLVFSTISITHLFDNVEDLQLAGAANLSGTGNGLDNMIIGNDGNNILDGGAGADTLSGNRGNDTLIGGVGADTFEFDMGENCGHDTIKDFLKAEDLLSFGAVGDLTKDGKLDWHDAEAAVSKIIDHGLGNAVDVFFSNGSEITFNGCGTGSVQHLTDLVDSSHIQVA